MSEQYLDSELESDSTSGFGSNRAISPPQQNNHAIQFDYAHKE